MSAELDALIARLTHHEETLQFDRFSNDDAWLLGSLLVRLATERGLAATFDIRRGDQQLFHAAMPGTAADNDAWIERKIRVVRRFGHSSFLVGQGFVASGKDFAETMALPLTEFAAHGGCFPIIIRDTGIVGTVTASGLPQADDHELVVEAIGLFLADQR